MKFFLNETTFEWITLMVMEKDKGGIHAEDLTPFPVLRLEPLLPLDHHLDGLSKLLQHRGLLGRLHPP